MTEKLTNELTVKLKVGTAIVAVFSLVSLLVGAGIAWEKIQARLRHLDGKTDVYQTRFDGLETRVSNVEKNTDVKFAEIQKDLTNIEALLVELKMSHTK